MTTKEYLSPGLRHIGGDGQLSTLLRAIEGCIQDSHTDLKLCAKLIVDAGLAHDVLVGPHTLMLRSRLTSSFGAHDDSSYGTDANSIFNEILRQSQRLGTTPKAEKTPRSAL